MFYLSDLKPLPIMFRRVKLVLDAGQVKAKPFWCFLNVMHDQDSRVSLKFGGVYKDHPEGYYVVLERDELVVSMELLAYMGRQPYATG